MDEKELRAIEKRWTFCPPGLKPYSVDVLRLIAEVKLLKEEAQHLKDRIIAGY